MAVLKKIWVCFLFAFIVMALNGCAGPGSETASKIVSPRNKSVPLQGKWVIEECLTREPDSSGGKPDGQWTGKTADFSKEAAILGEYSWKDVGYKIKRVSAGEYFLHKSKDSVKKLGISNKEISVITLSSADNFLYEFVKLDEAQALMYTGNELYRMKKVSDEADINFNTMTVRKEEDENGTVLQQNKQLHSGLLLGIRTPVKARGEGRVDKPEDYSYRTMWIASDDRVLRPMLEADTVFLPRMNGFWKVEVKKEVKDGRTEDILNAYSVSANTKNIAAMGKNFYDAWSDRNGVIRKTILFAGNDYVSVEIKGSGKYKGSDGTWEENRLQILPVDRIDGPKGVKISDITDENGMLAVEGAVNNALNTSNAIEIKRADEKYRDENFALFRKTGHWFIKGRLNLQQDEPVPYVDFNINLIPPAELVMYDTLYPPWTYIKNRIPETIDAYTSPEKDIAVILTRSQLFIYAIIGEGLPDVPLCKIKLRQGDSVIMAEWATASYVDNWEKAFVKNNEVRRIDADK